VLALSLHDDPGRGERGASAVEFALVLPLVLSLMLGTVQYSLYFWGRQTAAASAREAARRLAVGTDWQCTRAEALLRAGNAGNGAVVTMRYDHAGNTAVIGSLVEVTVAMSTLGPLLFPVPDRGAITEVAQSRVENIPAQPIGCT
jgi:hypothetical protein